MISIAVVDDEKIIREQIKNLIKLSTKECDIDVYATGEELLMSRKEYDVIFLDIQMDGRNGIETARILRQRNTVRNTSRKESILIFITGIKEYVFEAFDVAAFHYLLKPIEENKFNEVFKRAMREIERQKNDTPKQLFIKTRTRNITLNQSDILYIENRAKKVEVHTTQEVIEMYASMKELEKQLGGDFYRCHRGYLVNMAYIAEYESDSISLSNGETVFMAKDRYHEFVKVYMRYLRSGGEGMWCI